MIVDLELTTDEDLLLVGLEEEKAVVPKANIKKTPVRRAINKSLRRRQRGRRRIRPRWCFGFK